MLVGWENVHLIRRPRSSFEIFEYKLTCHLKQNYSSNLVDWEWEAPLIDAAFPRSTAKLMNQKFCRHWSSGILLQHL